MKISHTATFALVLAALASTQTLAADAPAGKVTEQQVLAELVEAQRTGDIMDGRTGKMLNELHPNLYPAQAKLCQLITGLIQTPLVVVRHHNIGTFEKRATRGGRADAGAGGSRHKDDLALEQTVALNLGGSN